MESIRKLKLLAGVYVSLLLFLLVCVILMPLIIRHGIAPSQSFVIEEETLEALLILCLFGISYLLLRGLLRTQRSYRRAAEQASQENASLLSRLAEAFQYIGTVNVEIHEIQSVLGGIDCYPRNKREFRHCLKRLAGKAMAITGAPWVVIRIIDPRRGRTVKECAAERREGALPAVTMGNRDILDGRRIEGFACIMLRPKKIGLRTVCVFPTQSISEAEHLLLTAILSQFEMLFLLHRSGCLQATIFNNAIEKRES
jgi:hypothetical protein